MNLMRVLFLKLMLILVLAGTGLSVLAQSPAPSEPDSPRVYAEASGQEETDASQSPGAGLNLKKLEYLYVPESRLSALFKKDHVAAIMPLKDFESLVQKVRDAQDAAFPGGKTPVLQTANYNARLESEHLVVDAELTLFNLSPDSEFDLNIAGWNVLAAKLDGQPAILARVGKNLDTLRLFLPKTGTQQLSLQVATSLQHAGNDVLASFGLPRAAAGQFEIIVPAGKSLQFDGMTPVRPAGLDEEAVYRIPIGGKSTAAMRITDGADQSRSDVLTFASTAYGVNIAPGAVTWNARTELQVFGQKIDQLVCRIPQSLELTDVESEGLDSWELGDDPEHPGRVRLTLKYHQPFDGSRSLLLQGILSGAGHQPWQVADLQIAEVTSHTGILLIQHPANVRLQILESQGVRPIADPDGQGSVDAGMERTAFAVWQEDFRLTFLAPLKEQQVQAAVTTLLSAQDEGVNLQFTLTLQTRQVPLFEARIRLPADYRVLGVTRDGTSVAWSVIAQDAGRNEVRIPLTPPLRPGQSSTFILDAQTLPEGWPVQQDALTLALPDALLPQVDMLEGMLAISAPEEMELVPVELVGLEPAQLQEMELLKERLQAQGQNLKLGFIYQDAAYQGQVRIARKPTLFTAETLTSFRIDRETVFTELDATLSFSGGGFRELQVQVSEFAGDQIQFRLVPRTPQTEPARIVEQIPGPTNNGFRDWTLKFDRYLRGEYLLTTQVNLPRGDAASYSPARLFFPRAKAQSGFVAIEGPEDQQVQISAKEADGTPLPLVDPVDLPGGSSQSLQRIVAGYRVIRPQWEISVTPTLFEREAIPTAIGHDLHLQSVWNPGSPFQHQARYRFSAVGMQSLLIRLPEEGELWSAMLDGKPVDARNVGGRIQIPLIGLSSSPEHTLDVIYHTPGAPAADRGDIRSIPPAVEAVSGSGEITPLDVLKQEWTLHYPRELILSRSEGSFRPDTSLLQQTYLSWFWNQSRQKDGGDLWCSAALLFAVAVALFIVRILWTGLQKILSPGRWTVGTTVLTLILIALVLIGVILPSREVARVARSSKDFHADEPMAPSANVAADDAALSSRESLDQDGELSRANLAIDKSETSPAVPSSPASGEKPSPHPVPNIGMNFNQIGDLSGRGASSSEVVSVDGKSSRSTGGLMSIPVELQVPDDSCVSRFEYNGSHSADQPAELRVNYLNRTTASVFIWVLASGTVLLGWWLRHSSKCLKLLYCFLTLVLPVAVLGIVPMLIGQVILQGLFLGGLVGILSWGLTCCIANCRLNRSPICRWWQRCCATVILTVAVLGANAHAQDVPAVSKPEEGTTSLHVIIPYKSLSEIDEAEHVYVPASLYKQLWELAHPEDARPEKTSVPFTVADASALASVVRMENGLRAQVRFRWVVVNFTDQQQIVPLPIREPGLESPQLDGEPGIISPLSDNRVGIVVPGRGTFLVDAIYTSPDEVTPEQGSIELNLLPSASGTLTVQLPSGEEPWQLKVNSRRGDYQRAVGDGMTTFKVPMDRGPMKLEWGTSSQVDVPTENVQVESFTRAHLDDAGVSLSQHITLDVKKGTLRQFVFDVPKGLSVRQVNGNDISGWEVRSEDDGNRLVIALRQPRNGKVQLTAELFQRQIISDDSKPFELLSLVPQGVERETGVIAISTPEQFRLRASNTSGLQQIDVEQIELPQTTNTSVEPQLGFRFISRPYQLQLDVSRRSAEAIATVDHGVQILRRKIRMATRISLSLTEVPRRVLEIQLPADYVPLDVDCDQDCDWYVAQGEPSRLIIEFPTPILNDVEINLEGQVARNPQTDLARITLPTVLHVSRMTSYLGVWCDSVYQPSLSSGGNWHSRPTNELPAVFRTLRPTPPVFGFQASGTPSELTFQLLRAVADVQGDAAILIAAGDAMVDYGLTLRWRISQAATDQFVLAVPDWLGTLEFTGSGIRQIHSESTGDGRTRWFISLIDPVRGEYLVTAAATVAMPDDGVIRTPRLDFETPNGVGVFHSLPMQRQFAVLVNLSPNQLVPVDLAQFEAVQVDQLPLNLPPQLVQQAMEIVRVRTDKIPSWKIQRMERAAGAQAIIPACTLTTVLQMDGSWRTQAVFAVRNRGQQFLALELPDASRILSVFVRGEPGRAVVTTLNDRTIHLIALPQTSAADLTFDVTLLLSGKLSQPLPEGFQLIPRSISLPVVQVVSPKESAEFGVTVAKTVWNVLVPDEVEAYPVEEGGASNVTFLRSSGWLATEEQHLARIRSDIAEMRRIALSLASPTQQRQAVRNLKQLQAELQTRMDLSSESSYSIKPSRSFSSDSFRYRTESQKAIEEAVSAIQEFESQQSPQLGVPSDQNQGIQRGYILQNNTLLLESNRAGESLSASKSSGDDEFNFRKKNAPQAPGEAGAKQSGPSEDARGVLRQQILSQNALDPAPQNAPFASPPSLGQSFRVESEERRFQRGAPPAYSAPVESRSEQKEEDEVGKTGSVRGLSIAMDLPRSGNELTFERAGGNPVLTLAVRPKWTWRIVAGGIWGLICLASGVWLLRQIRLGFVANLLRGVSLIGMVFGAAAFLLLAGPISNLGLLMFIVFGLMRIIIPNPAWQRDMMAQRPGLGSIATSPPAR